MTKISPVEVECSACSGVGWVIGGMWSTCKACGGLGRTWAKDAPGYGCSMTLDSRNVGEIVVIGNGDRGRIVRKDKTTVWVNLIAEFNDAESSISTLYPGCTGVASVSDPRWQKDDAGAGMREDQTDPVRRRNT